MTTITITHDDLYTRRSFAADVEAAFSAEINEKGGVLPDANIYNVHARMSRGRNADNPREVELALVETRDAFTIYRLGARSRYMVDAESGESRDISGYAPSDYADMDELHKELFPV